MRTTSLDKTLKWGGKNKAAVREVKKTLIANFNASLNDEPIKMLSFPGAVASLEKAVLEIPGAEVVGVQTDERVGAFSGANVLEKLSKVTEEGGFSLPTFVGRFSSLPEALRTGTFAGDNKVPASLQLGPWFSENQDVKFNVLELDVCCAFGPTVVDPLAELLADGRVADDSLMLVNHMKGREKPWFLEYLSSKYDWTEVGYGKKAPSKAAGSFYRYFSIPQFYSSLFLKYGFSCPITGVYEYRDKNDTGLAVNMVQYFFRAKKIANPKSFAACRASATRKAQAVLEEASSCMGTQFKGRIYTKAVD